MAKFVYLFIPLEGKHVEIVAKTKSQAIEEYHLMTGFPKDFIKKHPSPEYRATV